MHKLVILFEPPDDEQVFQPNWQKFLGLAEKMPGLRRETVGRVERVLFGKPEDGYALLHELLFDSQKAMESAMASPEGQAAGKFLQSFTGGKFVLLTAEHLEAGEKDFVKRET